MKDERSIVRAKVLAPRLVAHAGSNAAVARAATIDNVDIAVELADLRCLGASRGLKLSEGIGRVDTGVRTQ